MEKQNSILIADDQLMGRQLMESILYKENYFLIFANDGREAIEKALEFQPDLIILDVMMPYHDGFEVTKILRENPIFENTPIFLVTALDDRDSRIKGLEAGANDYISKPIDRLELLARVRTLVQLINSSKSQLRSTGESIQSKVTKSESGGASFRAISECCRVSQKDISKINSQAIIFSNKETESGMSGYYFKEGKEIIYFGNVDSEDSENAIYLESIISLSLRGRLLKSKNLFPDIILNDVAFETGSALKASEKVYGGNLNIILLIIDPIVREISYSGINSRMVLFNSGSWKEHVTQTLPYRFENIQKNIFEIKSVKYKEGDKVFVSTNSIFKTLNNQMWYEEAMFLDSVGAMAGINAFSVLGESLDKKVQWGIGIDLK